MYSAKHYLDFTALELNRMGPVYVDGWTPICDQQDD